MGRFLAVSSAIRTSPAARARQQTAMASGASRASPAAVPAAYSVTVVSGPRRSARRHAVGAAPELDSAGDGEPVRDAVMTSLILDHIPQPLVGTRVLDALHLGRVRDPMDGVCLPGEL